MVKMKAERLEKFSKEEIIKFYLRKDYDLEFYKEKFANTIYAGKISINGKNYRVYLEDESK